MPVFRDLFDLHRVVAPYILHPLTALEVFLPYAWPVSWFAQPNTFRPERDLPSLKDKVILVTGGNGGLGKESIFQLALSGPAKIYLTARSGDKGEAAIRDVLEKLSRAFITNLPEIVYLELDLSDLQSVKSAAEIVLARESRLDILMLNAGIMATPPSRSKSGHEIQLCTNHVGHFLLTRLLLPLMEKTASRHKDSDVRIVTVSSEAHHIAPPDFMDMIEDHDRLCSASPYEAYGVSKAANIVFTAEIARRYNDKGITSVSLHPGIIYTDLYVPGSDSNFILKYALPPLAYVFFDDVKNGALNQVWCAAGGGNDELIDGAYYTPVGKIRQSSLVNDEADGERLWNWTTKQVTPYLD